MPHNHRPPGPGRRRARQTRLERSRSIRAEQEAARRAAAQAAEGGNKENDPNVGNTKNGSIAGDPENFNVSTNQLKIRF